MAGNFFERNLLALSGRDPQLAARIETAPSAPGRYRFLEARTGEVIPAWVDSAGSAHPLHSAVDPRREARRLIGSLNTGTEGFLILLGLGGGYYAEAALEREDISLVLALDYGITGVAELFAAKDYTGILGDPRFHLMVDAGADKIGEYIPALYRPVLSEGIRTLPLRARTAFSPEQFTGAAAAVESAVKKISADYSVQAYFGTRWFSNIVRNVLAAGETPPPLASLAPLERVKRAAVAAAGPSLGGQTREIRERRGELFLIAVDTSLPVLLAEDISPDAVVSIDCQHISYYHFLGGLPENTLLFTDLASPPLVASRSASTRFFSGGHPLTRFVSRFWRAFPEVDTSGGNVTYAALSLAETLGAGSIEIYGADFSYPLGTSYARGAYIYPHFEIRQGRLSPLESLFSTFLYRAPLTKITKDRGWYYETDSLNFYRLRLEEKCRSLNARVIPVEGLGAPLQIPPRTRRPPPGEIPDFFSPGAAKMNAVEFLSLYGKKIESLPAFKGAQASWLHDRSAGEYAVLTTLLPAAAAIKRRHPDLKTAELLDETKGYCLRELAAVLKTRPPQVSV
jgi:hypothetical protein